MAQSNANDLESLRRQIRDDANNSALWTRLGMQELESGDSHKALASFKKGAAIKPDGNSFRLIGGVYLLLGDANEAAVWLEKAHRLK